MASEDRLFAIRDAIVARVRLATGIGPVYNYMRWASSEEAFQTLAVTSGTVNMWQISRTNTEERWLTGFTTWRVHTFTIYGCYGLMDSLATETTFQALIERVAKRFRTLSGWTLDGAVESIAPYMGPMASSSPQLGARGGIQVESVGHIEKNNKLLHWVEMRVGVQDQPESLDE